MRLYIGNIPWAAAEDDLRAAFEKHGAIVDCCIITDRETGRSKGFGFVEYEKAGDGKEAVYAMHGLEFMGRELQVNEARPKQGATR